MPKSAAPWLQSWWLDADMCLSIRHHHSLAALAPNSTLSKTNRLFIATVHFAEHFSQQQLGLDMTQEWHKFGNACLETLQIDEDDMEFLYAEAKQVVAQQIKQDHAQRSSACQSNARANRERLITATRQLDTV